MSQYIIHVMVADYWNILPVNVLQIWLTQMEIWFLANISTKYTMVQKPGSRIHEFVQMTLN